MKFIHTIDNLMPASYATYIENTLLGATSSVPWDFLEDVTYTNAREAGLELNPAFEHVYFAGGQIHTEFFHIVVPVFHQALAKINYTGSLELVKVRSFLQLPSIKRKEYNNIHVDLDFPHLVCLYYVNDVDGDTFIFDDNNQIISTITPKKNRVVLFDGSLRHSSSKPTTGPRTNINFDLVVEFDKVNLPL